MFISWWLAVVLMSKDHVIIEMKGDFKTKTECREASEKLNTERQTLCLPIAHEAV